jgi:hypothetical protein
MMHTSLYKTGCIYQVDMSGRTPANASMRTVRLHGAMLPAALTWKKLVLPGLTASTTVEVETMLMRRMFMSRKA